MTDLFTLYGMAGSLYTAKVRAYMRQNHVAFVEKKAGTPEFKEEIVPQIGRWIIPVLKTPDGELIQDGTDILDFFDTKGFSKNPITPTTPALRAVAHLFELFGGEGLMRPAMHYRWGFINLTFMHNTFNDVLPNGLDDDGRSAAFDFASGRMRKAGAAFGVSKETAPTIEKSHRDFLTRFNAHLEKFPFLQGGHPTIGDYGLFGALYAHMGRDPAPLHLMQTIAPNVFRWTERMNMPEIFIDEIYEKSNGQLIDDANIPDTLKELMQYISEEYLTEITAHVEFANNWLTERPDIKPGTDGTGKKPGALTRRIGMANFEWRGHEIQTAVMPYRFYLLQRLQDVVAEANQDDQNAIRTLFADTGLESLLKLKTIRRVKRVNHLEVWGPVLEIE